MTPRSEMTLQSVLRRRIGLGATGVMAAVLVAAPALPAAAGDRSKAHHARRHGGDAHAKRHHRQARPHRGHGHAKRRHHGHAKRRHHPGRRHRSAFHHFRFRSFGCPSVFPYHSGAYLQQRLLAQRAAAGQGGLDLNVRPRRAEVWVNGHRAGEARRLDGTPDYLWLDEGRHEIIVHAEGRETVRQEVSVLAGNLKRLKLRMERGEATPPRELMRRHDRLGPSTAPPSAASKPPGAGTTSSGGVGSTTR